MSSGTETRTNEASGLDNLNRHPPAVRDYNHNLALDTIDAINQELSALQEKILNLSVRSHMLEVDLAIQYTPDQMLELETLDESCAGCCQAIEQLSKSSVQLLCAECPDESFGVEAQSISVAEAEDGIKPDDHKDATLT